MVAIFNRHPRSFKRKKRRTILTMLPKLNTLKVQEGKLGRPFKQIGLRKNLQKPSMWLNKVDCYHWIYEFKYVECGGFFEIEVDYQNKFVSKTSL